MYHMWYKMVVSTPQKKGGTNKNSTPPLYFEEKPPLMAQEVTLTATGINTPLLYDSLGHYPGEHARTLTITRQ